jgi:hypothetical protein
MFTSHECEQINDYALMSLLYLDIAIYFVLRNVTELCKAISCVVWLVTYKISFHLLPALTHKTVPMHQPWGLFCCERSYLLVSCFTIYFHFYIVWTLYSLNRSEADYLLQDVAYRVIRYKQNYFNYFERPVTFLNVKCVYSSSRITVAIFVKYVSILRKIINGVAA